MATLLSVWAGPLGRIEDRARVLEAKLEPAEESTSRVDAIEELMRLAGRARLVNLAIGFSRRIRDENNVRKPRSGRLREQEAHGK